MKNFLKRLVGFSLGPVLGAAVSFLLFPIFINLLPLTEYGRAGGFQHLLLQVPTFIYLGLDQAYTREYHHQKDKINLIQQAMLPSLLLSFLLGFLGVIFAGQISFWQFKTAEYFYIIYFAAIWIICTVIERFIHLSIRMEEKAFEFSFFNLLLKIGNFLVSMLLIMVGFRDFRVVIYGTIFGHILADLILFYRYRSCLDFREFKIESDLMRKMFQFGLPIMVATSLSGLLNVVDIFFLQSFSDFDNIGIYKAGSQLAAVLGIMRTAFVSFWVPTAYRWYEESKTLKHYKYISDLILLGMAGIYFVLLIFKQPIAQILNPGGSYNEFKYIVGLLAFPHLMYTLSETTTLGIVFSRRTHYNIIVSLLSLIVSVIINVWLTPQWGYRGAALASTGAYMTFYLARTYFSSKTGFYFGQAKQVLTMILMMVAGLINLFPINNSLAFTFGIGLLAFVIQIPTIATSLAIRKDPEEWDFS